VTEVLTATIALGRVHDARYEFTNHNYMTDLLQQNDLDMKAVDVHEEGELTALKVAFTLDESHDCAAMALRELMKD